MMILFLYFLFESFYWYDTVLLNLSRTRSFILLTNQKQSTIPYQENKKVVKLKGPKKKKKRKSDVGSPSNNKKRIFLFLVGFCFLSSSFNCSRRLVKSLECTVVHVQRNRTVRTVRKNMPRAVPPSR